MSDDQPTKKIQIHFKPLPKQVECLKYLKDDTTRFILYGGSKGSGKSRLGCSWLILNCLQYPSTRWMMGRARLQDLYKTTFQTFQQIVKEWGLEDIVQINFQRNIITFKGYESQIFMLDLYPDPSDLEYNNMSGLELTGAFIDELSDIDHKAFEIIKTLIRYRLKEYGLTPKILMASNPCQGWPFDLIYKPWEEGRLPSDYQFVQAFTADNTYLGEDYVKQLGTMEEGSQKERLLHGSWYYASNENELFDRDAVTQSFYNQRKTFDNNWYISCDVADLGEDYTVIVLWQGWHIVSVEKLRVDQVELASRIKALMSLFHVPVRNVIFDANGSGAAMPTLVRGSVRYIPHMRALKEEKYKTIKAQLMYNFARHFKQADISFGLEYNDDVVKELCAYKKRIKNDIHDVSLKQEVKNYLKRSPDTADALYMRSYFDYRPSTGGGFSIIN